MLLIIRKNRLLFFLISIALYPLSLRAMSDSTAAANAFAALTTLETRLQEQEGRIEQVEHELSLLREELKVLTGDLELRFADLQAALERVEQGLVKNKEDIPKSAVVTPVKPKVDKHSIIAGSGNAGLLPTSNVQQHYDEALANLKARNLAGAAKILENLLKEFPSHELAPNFYYWLGEAYLGQSQNNKTKLEKALRTFAEGYEKHSQSNKGPDLLLKVALCLEKQQKKEETCIVLKQLDIKKPVSMRVQQEVKALRTRLKCP